MFRLLGPGGSSATVEMLGAVLTDGQRPRSSDVGRALVSAISRGDAGAAEDAFSEHGYGLVRHLGRDDAGTLALRVHSSGAHANVVSDSGQALAAEAPCLAVGALTLVAPPGPRIYVFRAA